MLSERSHLHPYAVLLFSVKLLKELILPLVILLSTKVSQTTSDPWCPWVVVAGSAFVLFILLWGLFSWHRFTYSVTDNELRVEHGVVIRKRTFIPRERIQTIDLTQGLGQRIFGVMTVKVETAGGMKPEAVLSAVSAADAARLKEALLLNTGTEERGSEPVCRLTRTLSRRDLLVCGLTSGGSFGMALSFLLGGFSLLDDFLRSAVDVNVVLEWVLASGLFLLLAVVVVGGLWLLALLSVMAYFSGFTITRTEDRLQVAHGFFHRREISIPIQRIQAVCLVEGLLRQPFGYVALQVESAGYATESSKKALLWPLLPREQVADFLAEYVPEFSASFTLQPLTSAAGQRYALGPLLPLALVLVPLAWGVDWGGYALPLLPLGVLWGWWRYRDAAWGFNKEMLAVRFRSFNRTTALIPRACVQSLTVSASPWQRRAALASFKVPLASQAVFGLAHIGTTDGDRLLKWVERETFCPERG